MKRLFPIFIFMVGVGYGPELNAAELDSWGKTTPQKAEFHAAGDVPKSQIELTKKWYKIATKAWENYGPLEFWIVGSNEAAATALDKIYCKVRKQKDPTISLKHCLNRGHNFVSYAKGGNAGLNTRRNENERWSGFIITMSAKYPGPEEEDYKPVVLHEYFHVYQHAHIHSKKRAERQNRNQKNHGGQKVEPNTWPNCFTQNKKALEPDI